MLLDFHFEYGTQLNLLTIRLSDFKIEFKAKLEDATEKVGDLKKNITHLETKCEQLAFQRDDLNIAIEVNILQNSY